MDITKEYAESWDSHAHGEVPDAVYHLHAVDADWGIGFELSMNMIANDDLDVINLMEFRALVIGMGEHMEKMRSVTELEPQSVNEQQFAILAYNVDRIFTQTLLQVVDKALVKEGVNPPCQLQKVKSSNIRSFGFVQVVADEADEVPDTGTLYVAFTSGGLYAYENVPAIEVEGFIAASSKGAYFQSAIRNGGYEFRKVAS